MRQTLKYSRVCRKYSKIVKIKADCYLHLFLISVLYWLYVDGGRGEAVNTPGCGPGTRGFKSRRSPHLKSINLEKGFFYLSKGFSRKKAYNIIYYMPWCYLDILEINNYLFSIVFLKSNSLKIRYIIKKGIWG